LYEKKEELLTEKISLICAISEQEEIIFGIFLVIFDHLKKSV